MDFGNSSPFFDLSSKPSKTIKKNYKRINKDERAALRYRARNPQPTYGEFKNKIDLVDESGREYILSKMDDLLKIRSVTSANLLLTLPSLDSQTIDREKISLTKEQDWKTQVLWIRVPSWQKGTIGFPSPSERITFYDPKTQVTAIGTVDSIFHEPKRSTGFLILNNFITMGQTKNPQQFEYIVDKEIKTKIEKSHF